MVWHITQDWVIQSSFMSVTSAIAIRGSPHSFLQDITSHVSCISQLLLSHSLDCALLIEGFPMVDYIALATTIAEICLS
ncbi:hypothetical protein M404DRAFT_1005112, partial [Pisolithus tinctorius Marx 270]